MKTFEPKPDGLQIPDTLRIDIHEAHETERKAKKEITELLYARPDMVAALTTRKEGYETITQFYDQVTQYFRSVEPGTKIRAITQTGPDGGTVLTHCEGTLSSKGDRYFNMIVPGRNKGKPFTIGYSCLQYIEIMESPE